MITALGTALLTGTAIADVTVQESTSVQVSFFKAHNTEIKQISGDKQRSESNFACDGMMKLLCGKKQSLDVQRLDRSVTWQMDPKHKSFTEIPFPTPEQQRAVIERQRAALEKLKSCPSVQSPTHDSLDTTKCELSKPVVKVTDTGETATLVGHDSRRTNLTMTQSCKVKDTGDECNLAYSFDVWLTKDEVQGLADQRAYQKEYLKKLGLTPSAAGWTPTADPTQLSPLLAPYAASLKDLSTRSADLKGTPLKTTFRFSYGGPHCAAAANKPTGNGQADPTLGNAGAAAGDAAASSTTSAAGSSATDAARQSTGNGVAGAIAGSAAGAFAQNLVGGLFAKHKKDDSSASTHTGAAATPGSTDSMNTIAELTVETTSIDTAAVPAAQFEVPTGWKKITPEPQGEAALPNCPNAS